MYGEPSALLPQLLRGIRLEIRRRDHLQHLHIVRVADFAMPDAWRLVEARSRLHQNFANAFVFKFGPALQHIYKLHVAVMPVPFTVRRFARKRANHVAHHFASRGAVDAQVAILEVAAQPLFKAGRSRMAYPKFPGALFRHRCALQLLPRRIFPGRTLACLVLFHRALSCSAVAREHITSLLS